MIVNDISRRQFLASLLVAASSSGLIYKYLVDKRHDFKISYLGQDSGFLHALRDQIQDFKIPSYQVEEFDCIVVGGGVSGLSAIYNLEKRKEGRYCLFEAQASIGGNSQSGENHISKYPFGAHYLPLPKDELVELIDFLLDINVCKKEDNNIKYFDEYLIHHPETRLKYRGVWYDGIIPFANLSEADLADLAKLKNIISKFRISRGKDAKIAFNIPVCNSSQEQEFIKLDDLTCKEYLINQGITSEFVHWYVNYGVRDDYGASYEDVSAWAGIHYFASRDEKDDQKDADLMTWPQGNGFLVQGFKDKIKSKVNTNTLILQVKYFEGYYYVFLRTKDSSNIHVLKSKSIISSASHLVNKKIFGSEFSLPKLELEYSPWLIANLCIDNLPTVYQNIPWDSVSYHHDSLGFVRADHQNLTKANNGTVLTYYLPFSSGSASLNRHKLFEINLEERSKLILNELDEYYSGLSKYVNRIDYWIWGHAMPRPKPGVISQAIKNKLNKVHANAFLAHTDYSGISIFEEAFYQGVRASNAILDT